MVSVFLSHSSKDKPFVRDLADALEAGGVLDEIMDEVYSQFPCSIDPE
jgi:hypothetical protein